LYWILYNVYSFMELDFEFHKKEELFDKTHSRPK